jgi:hypothetical protein
MITGKQTCKCVESGACDIPETDQWKGGTD